MSKRQPYSSTKAEAPAIPASFKEAVKALLQTPPPPPGDPSTRKQKPKKRKKR